MSQNFHPRKHVAVNPERVSHTLSTDYPGHFADEDHSWNPAKFKKTETSRKGGTVIESVDRI
ncbi:hypothetical protein PISMIDRAFT_682114 [Pisolithus microcarpus 441]|uniref:Unplaced genomic scaffold scaffold_76, whole genome shotgun sequence n=1 Tax=Pisolithus microcarpus 441 TaxID=765257 RepID=A0A0C9Z3A3_9AGAM|nr:hypothetical protein BKA83DRAFT_682114 [Pisolithus microcarpus]KIK20714.1 hypothetical protein PISMIDRAFT_682114 [Pisolithus microcarpus 441]